MLQTNEVGKKYTLDQSSGAEANVAHPLDFAGAALVKGVGGSRESKMDNR